MLDGADRRPPAPQRLRPAAIGPRVSSPRSLVSNAALLALFADLRTCLPASCCLLLRPVAENSAPTRSHPARPVSFARSAAVIAQLHVAAFPAPSAARASAAYCVAGSPDLPAAWQARPASSGRPLHPSRAVPPEMLY